MKDIAVYDLGKRARRKKAVTKTALYMLLILISVFLIFPYVFMLNRSFMTTQDVVSPNVYFFPRRITVDAYSRLFVGNGYFRNIWNTLRIVLLNMVIAPVASSLCAYGFARINFKGRKFVFAAVMSTMMIPGAIVQVPLYVMFTNLGMTGTFWPLVVPSFFGGGAINIFLLIQFMRNIPIELDNAAKLDGLNVFQRFIRICLPLCGPILFFVGVNTAIICWGDFYGPLIYLNNAKQYTLSIRIYLDSTRGFVAAYFANVRMAAGVFMSLIPLLIFAVYQRKLVDGIMIGAIKM